MYPLDSSILETIHNRLFLLSSNPEKGVILDQGTEQTKVFPRNAFGGFDIYKNE